VKFNFRETPNFKLDLVEQFITLIKNDELKRIVHRLITMLYVDRIVFL
jgi:hypothetical protein